MKNRFIMFLKVLCYIIIAGSFILTFLYFVAKGTNAYFSLEVTDILIAQLLSTCSLMISGLLSQQYTVENNRLHDYHEIITKETRANALYVREHAVNLLTLSDPVVIDSVKEDSSYVLKITDSKYSLLAQFKIIVPQEVDLINCIDELCDKAVQYYNQSSEENRKQLCKLIEKFYYLFSLYDYSDWRYLKAHAKLIDIQDISDWEAIYKEQERVFEKSSNSLKLFGD